MVGHVTPLARRTCVIAAIAVVAGVFWVGDALKSDGKSHVFCTADARLGPNGATYGRDPSQGCRFVDETGHVLPGQ